MNDCTNFQIVAWQRFEKSYVTEETCGWRNRQLVTSGIRALDSCGELTEIILLICLYKFLYEVHNQQTLTAGFLSPFVQYCDADFYLKQIFPVTCFRSNLPQFTSYQTLKVIKILCFILYVVESYVILLLR
jgi:hypothetical protein